MTAKRLFHYDVIVPRQGRGLPVFTFAARPADLAAFARIERAARDEEGGLLGFQRPQIAAHIREIRDYLERPEAILPNPIVVAFTGRATIEFASAGTHDGTGLARLTIDATDGPPGWIVDGQQRFTALREIKGSEFEVLVSGFLCEGIEELQRQFILINNTRPLPKALVYELLPQVRDLPHRMSSRSQAAIVAEALNYDRNSSLRGAIKQQTNPKGFIRDTALQKVVMNSIGHGALRLYADDDARLLSKGVPLVSEFFHAVKHVFAADWNGHSPKTSRLIHGTGIVAMGYVMDALNASDGAEDRDAFAQGLRPLVGRTAWCAGEWDFGNERRRWNGLQNVPADVRQLSVHLVQELRRAPGQRSAEAA